LELLNANARNVGISQVNPADDLFKLGVLDSFALVDFVATVEEQCDIKIPDSDVNPSNFQTIEVIDEYVRSRKG
jgi:acyl carrier protein